MSEADFYAFEAELDVCAAALPVLALPIRATYSALSGIVSTLFHGSDKRPLAAYNVAGRLSYLATLLANCAETPIGTSAYEAVSAYFSCDLARDQTKFLLAYAHFSELVAEVRRNYYDVESTASGFRLDHTTPAFAHYEMRDIITSEIALPHLRPSSAITSTRLELLNEALSNPGPGVRLSSGVIAGLMKQADLYEASICEISLLDDAGCEAAFGTGRGAFSRLQALILAFCDHASAIASALEATGQSEDAAEVYDWRILCWRENPLLGMFVHLGNGMLTSANVDSILSFFILNYRGGNPDVGHAGDGYMPPFIFLDDCIMFNADLVRVVFQLRNVLYALNIVDRPKFDNLVSGKLEPHLISQFMKVLYAIPDTRAIANVNWSSGTDSGEIDVLIYDELANVAVQCQVKAAIPPHGARLVQRLDGRMKEGIQQLEKFRSTSSSHINSALSRAFNTTVVDATLVDALVARVSFGTLNVNAENKNIALVTLPIIALVVRRALDSGIRLSLKEIIEDASNFAESVISKINAHWSREELTLVGKLVQVPMFQYEHELVDFERMAAYDAQVSFGIR